MCGIFGAYSTKGRVTINEKELKILTDTMLHRGPDGSGYVVASNFAFGHRRLSIIDLSEKGQQPMYDKDRTVCIVFNGEIYNFQEIREELLELGFLFDSNTDTEVILYSYKAWGMDCVKKFNGMFAFALLDLLDNKLFLVRDRVGIKPLYYTHINNEVIFSSELKPLIKYPGFKKSININAISSYLSYRYVIGKESFFENVYSVLAGQVIEFSNEGKKESVYWDIPIVTAKQKKSEKEYTKEIGELLVDSIKKRMVSDVSVGAYLSGGLDSSLIVANMCIFGKNKPITYTIGFKEEGYSEFEFSDKVANMYQIEHKKILMKPEEYFRKLKELIRIKDGPLGVPNEVPLYVMSKELKKDFTVVLSGEGADEIFGGYGRIFRSPFDYYRLKLNFFPFTVLFSKIFKKYGHVKFKNKIDHFLHEYTYFPWEEKKLLFTQDVVKKLDGDLYCREIIKSVFKKTKKLHYYDQIMYIFTKIHIVGLLGRVDATTMGASVEGRVPFLDHRLVEYMAKVPYNFKIRMNSLISCVKSLFFPASKISENLDTTKYILRKMAENKLPEDIVKRKKLGFPVPLNEWLGLDFNEYGKGILLSKEAKINEFFDQESLEFWIKNMDVKKNPLQGQKIWRLINLELWLQEYS